MFQDIEPYEHGVLEVGDGNLDGNLVYWEACGSPQGKPAVVLHGGPGSGCTVASPALRSRRVSSRAVRPARVRAEHAARQRR